ncbi:hypothetical protein D918_09419, partial [Trichuris suis]
MLSEPAMYSVKSFLKSLCRLSLLLTIHTRHGTGFLGKIIALFSIYRTSQMNSVV